MPRDARLLVIGDYPVGYANGIGETLANLLKPHPDGELFQLHPSHLRPLPGEGRGRAETFDAPRRPDAWPASAGAAYQPILKLRQVAAERRLFHRAAALIRQHRISAVLAYPVTPWVLFAVVRLRRAFPRVRFVFYVMDDWQGHHTCFGLPFTKRRRAALAEIVATSDARFACSWKMKQDYEQRFHNGWQVLHKGVVPQDTRVPAAPPRSAVNILYTGAMNMFRFDAVLAFVEGLGLYRAASGRDVTLTLLGPTQDEFMDRLRPYSYVRWEPWVDNATCQRRMIESDCLYLPLSFAPKLERIANLAMPTKFPEYLAAGRPAIFHVPAESEVNDLATRAGLPLRLTTVNPREIRDFLAAFVERGVDPQRYQDAARALLAAEFDERVLQARLHEALFPVVSESEQRAS